MDSDSVNTIAFYKTLFVEGYCDLAAFSLIIFEYAITVDKEVALVWGRKFNGATVLFLLNRYLALLKYPIYIVDMFPVSDQGCVASNVLSKVLEVLPYFVWISFSILRVYAISGHNWKVALLVALPGAVPLASNIYLYYQTASVNAPLPVGCIWLSLIPHPIYSALLVATRTSVILTDVLVLVITWWRTYGIRKAVAEANVKVSLSTLLLRDGTIYFLVLLVMNTFHIAFSLTRRFTWTITLEEPLTTILVSRFLLNLRELDSRGGPDSMGDMSCPSFVRRPDEASAVDSMHIVSSFIAPLGAPLRHGDTILGDTWEADLDMVDEDSQARGEACEASPFTPSQICDVVSTGARSIEEVSV